MKAIVTSDWHGDWVTRGVPRFDDVANAARASVDRAIEIGADAYFFLGDLADPDKNFTTFRCVKLAIECAMRLSDAGIASHWLVGNHDVIEDGSGSSVLCPMDALADYAEGGTLAFWERPGISPATTLGSAMSVLALPFAPLSHDYNPRDWVDRIIDLDEPFIVLSHLSVDGIIPGEETTEMPRGRNVVLPHRELAKRKAPTLILQGHYHDHQVFENVHVCGSLVRLTFGEEKNTPGYLEVEF